MRCPVVSRLSAKVRSLAGNDSTCSGEHSWANFVGANFVGRMLAKDSAERLKTKATPFYPLALAFRFQRSRSNIPKVHKVAILPGHHGQNQERSCPRSLLTNSNGARPAEIHDPY